MPPSERVPAPPRGRFRPGPAPVPAKTAAEVADPLVRRFVNDSLATAAGRFFRVGWAEPRRLPAAPADVFVVHLEAGATTFRLLGHAVPVSFLARVIRACPEWGGRPVVLVPHPLPAFGPFATLVDTLVAQLGVPVHAADAGVWQIPGTMITGGTIRRWPVRAPGLAGAPGAGEPVSVGPWLPACAEIAACGLPGPEQVPVPGHLPEPAHLPEPLCLPEPLRLPTPIPAPLPAPAAGLVPGAGLLPPAVRRALPTPAAWTPLPPRPDPARPADDPVPDQARIPDRKATELTSPETERPTGDATATAGRSWRQVRPRAAVEDREPLRALLGWQFEAHARAISSTLALQPGLRLGVNADDPLASLVALRGYLSGGEPPATAARIDAVLRDSADPTADPKVASGDTAMLAMMARCASAGLGRLPAAVGPVFRPAAIGLDDLASYQPGRQIVEPGFLVVSTAPWRVPTQTVEYVIWASTARRTDALNPERAPGEAHPPGRALFPAGTRFVVLAVDDATSSAGADGAAGTAGATAPVRVLLREVVNGRTDAAAEQRVLGRLREALTGRGEVARTSPVDAPRQLGLAVGLDDEKRPYALDGGRPVDDRELAGTS